MTSDKYVGLDVHKATIVAAVLDATGKCVISSIIETKTETMSQKEANSFQNSNVTPTEGRMRNDSRKPLTNLPVGLDLMGLDST